MKASRSSTRAMLVALAAMAPRHLWLGGMALASLTVLMGMALLGLSGWFIAATALAGLVPATALVFDVFMPSAGIRLLALGRTGLFAGAFASPLLAAGIVSAGPSRTGALLALLLLALVPLLTVLSVTRAPGTLPAT